MNTRSPRRNASLRGLTFCVCLIIAGAITPCSNSEVVNGVGKLKIERYAQSIPTNPVSAGETAVAARAYGRLPLYFIANLGQVNGKVAFYETGSGHTTFFTRKGIVLGLKNWESKPYPIRHEAAGSRTLSLKSPARRAARVRTSYLRIGMLGMSKEVQVVPENPQQGKVNFFIGNDRHRWHTNIPTYRAILYRNAFPGIDIKFYGNNSRLEYDIIARPGSDPSAVKFRYSGAKDIRLTRDGDLEVELSAGRLILQKPVVYQQVEGRRVMRRGAFMVREDRYAPRDSKASAWTTAGHRTFTCGFDLGPYDPSTPLVVDPTLVYSTYLGGSVQDVANSIAIDASGNVYVTGSTSSTDFPTTPGAFQSALNSSSGNVFVTELAAGGASLSYSTYLGGTAQDVAKSIAIDASGNAYVTGSTSSTDFPITPGAFQTTLTSSSGNGFVTEIAAGGASLGYSTYLGGSTNDSANSIAIDASGNAYVTGSTSSTDFPITPGAFQTTLTSSSGNGFVTEIAAGGASLGYSTYLGGSTNDSANSIAVDASGNVYVTGSTSSADFPITSGSFQTTLKSSSGNGFVTSVAAGGASLNYSTYLGGSVQDSANSIAVDASGNAYVTGQAESSDFPITTGSFQTTLKSSSGNGFVTELAAGGASLIYSTYLGGSANDSANSIAVDASGNVYVTGSTSSADFPIIPGAFQTTLKSSSGNCFVTAVAAGGASLIYSTYLGGSANDSANSIAVDTSGNAYVTGKTSSTDFPATSGAFQASLNSSNGNGFVTDISLLTNGACGTSNGGSFGSAPASNLCGAGTASTVTAGTGTWAWTCAGQYRGTTASCSASIPAVNGACGSANGEAFLAAPSSNLCTSGAASTVAGSGPWTWTCAGQYGGTDASCSADLGVNGEMWFGSSGSYQTVLNGSTIQIGTLPSPLYFSVTPMGGSGSDEWSYEVIAVDSQGHLGTPDIAFAPNGVPWASIGGSVYNALSWSSVAGAVSYNIYRLLAPSGGTTGLIANVTGGTSFNDTGQTASGSVPLAQLVIGNGGLNSSLTGTDPLDPLSFESSGTLNGQYNTFIGMDCGISNTTGNQNTFIGRAAGMANTTGTQNTFIGEQAGATNTTGYHNVFIGEETWNVTGSYDTYVGIDCGLTATGDGNVFLGEAAGSYNTASNDVSIGMGSGSQDSAGRNVYVGTFSGTSGTTATGSTMVGYASGENTTTGANNTFIGYLSGVNNYTGFDNTYIGGIAGLNAGGDRNSALGYGALGNASGPTDNNAIGYQSLYFATGERNDAIGSNALVYLTSGFDNEAVGYSAMGGLTTGYLNIALGFRAGQWISGGSVANTTSNTSIYIGPETMPLANGDSNEIVIGYNNTGNGSNTTQIGNSKVTQTGLGKLMFYGPTTFANLPACSLTVQFASGYITDGPPSPNWHQVISAGGGITPMKLFCNGTNWTVEAY